MNFPDFKRHGFHYWFSLGGVDVWRHNLWGEEVILHSGERLQHCALYKYSPLATDSDPAPHHDAINTIINLLNL